MLSDSLVLKSGSLVQLAEASTMRYIAKNTSIPVPKVYCAFVRKGITYILMERIKGDILGNGWLKRSEESKTKLLTQLKGMIGELRRLQSPLSDICIGNVDGGPFYEERLYSKDNLHGPFKTIREFHLHIRRGRSSEEGPWVDPEVNELFSLHEKPWGPIVFTHGDLSSLNVLARGDDISGIIDWETAGWFPSYWEYTTACQVNPYNPFWREEIERFLEPNPEALEMERIRQRCFGVF